MYIFFEYYLDEKRMSRIEKPLIRLKRPEQPVKKMLIFEGDSDGQQKAPRVEKDKIFEKEMGIRCSFR